MELVLDKSDAFVTFPSQGTWPDKKGQVGTSAATGPWSTCPCTEKPAKGCAVALGVSEVQRGVCSSTLTTADRAGTPINELNPFFH